MQNFHVVNSTYFSAGIVIYGAGRRCEYLMNMLSRCDINVNAVFDSDKNKVGSHIGDNKILGKDMLLEYRDNFWCISIQDPGIERIVREELVNVYGFHGEKYVFFDEILFESVYKNKSQLWNVVSHKEMVESKIFFALPFGFVLGGIEERVKALCLALIESGVNQICVLTRNIDEEVDVDERLENHIQRIDLSNKEFESEIENVLEFLLTELPCTVVTNQYDPFLFASLLIKRKYPEMIRVISIISGADDGSIERNTQLPVKADLYIGVSKEIKEKVILKNVDTPVISMRVPFPCPKEIEKTYSKEGTPIHIGYAGRLDGISNSQKRMDLLVKVIAELNKMEVPFEFEIAGDGPAKDEMIQLFKDLKVDKRVCFHGKIKKNEIMSFWLGMDVGLNMADFEGRSISNVEAMGGGAVPVVTDVSGVREDIIDGVNGFIVPVGDYRMAAEKIAYLHENRNRLMNMGNQAHNDIYPKSRMEDHVLFWKGILNV